METSEIPSRRPLKSRKTRWASSVSSGLARAGIQPNVISILSILFSLVAAVLLILSRDASALTKVLCYLLAACAIQLRLLCNLFDGMVAIESGFKTKSGEIFNDFPDRLSDPLILVGAGYSIPSFEIGPEIGWLAGTLAILTAYVRVLGGSAGATQLFIGPMAKQHRMAVMTGALLLSAVGVLWSFQETILFAALFVIGLGSLLTVGRRLIFVVKELEEK